MEKLRDQHAIMLENYTNDLLKQKSEIQEQNKLISDSIKHASMIQFAFLPDEETMRSVLDEFFIIWEPKDIVGGDIYFVEKIDEEQFLLFIIDCAGHGVPGALMTSLVKAIQSSMIADIKVGKSSHPAMLLSEFNTNIKKALKQESKDSKSNSGFDGGVILFNKQTKLLHFAGAHTPLFLIQNADLEMIKGDRHSVGYRSSDYNHHFQEHVIELKEGDCVYLTTDGYLDQLGGEKELSFGKKRFKQVIKENYNLPMFEQKDILLNELKAYQGQLERVDDVTVFGFRV
ncbi:MAG: serine/threonine-protein phosphatase [SAR324 cluster bacterium]|nr:serine/threonine-protein phosphatase [SAR324 cluster bacterium]